MLELATKTSRLAGATAVLLVIFAFSLSVDVGFAYMIARTVRYAWGIGGMSGALTFSDDDALEWAVRDDSEDGAEYSSAARRRERFPAARMETASLCYSALR